MAVKMVMPLLGQTMEEGTIIQWFKKEGEEVKAGEPLLEVMTDKVNMEVEAPESGVLRKIIAQPDDIVPVKDPICIIAGADESIDDLLVEGGAAVSEQQARPEAPEPETVEAGPVPQTAASAAPAGVGSEGRIFSSPAARRVAREHGIDIALLANRGTGPGGRIVEKDVLAFAAAAPKTTPLAGKIAADLGVDLSAVPGTGIGGRITAEDVERAGAAPSPVPVPAEPASIGATIPFAGLRKAVASAVSGSIQSAVHVTLVSEVDMTECAAMRGRILDDIERRHGVRVSYTDIIVKAAARAILDKPIVNASLQGESIIIADHVNIGVATAVENGLVVPVVRDVQSKTLPQVSREIKELVERARAGKAGPEDFRGGTFSVTNLGSYGIDSFNPVITPGQSAILGVCRIVQKPVVLDGAIQIRSMMNLCLTFDHRVMDGAPAAEYLARLKEVLESPYLIFV